MIPAPFIQDLLSRIDIVEVIGRYVQLKKAGSSHKGLCPFHGEKSPSFSVSATRQTYHCFGCGVHGNSIGFLMAYCGQNFLDSVRDLAQQLGVTMPEDDRSPEERERADKLKEHQATLSEVLAKAATHYRGQLKIHTRAIDYLKGRGLTGDIAAAFELGYAPDAWRGLASVFPNYDDILLEESGLVVSQGSDDATRKRYDRFRDRIIFPIRSVQGEIVGFGGRVLDKGEPKYLNSPETATFIKGRELYGLYEARAALRQFGYALVVEGYMDVVALAQLGFPNAVATLGTACTAEHVQKLFRFTDSVVFSFDGDAAGRRAANRALEASLAYANDTRSIRFLFLPTEHDPDSFIRELGPQSFEHLIAQAVPLSRHLIAAAREGCDQGSAEGRAKLLSNAKPMWSVLPDGVLKLQMLGDLAQIAGLSSTDLSHLWQSSATNRRSTETLDADRPKPQRNTTEVKSRRARTAPARPADTAMRMLLLHSDWWDMLDAADHDLLHRQQAPHGALCAWLERFLHQQGPSAWASLEAALLTSEWADILSQLVPPSALQDKMEFADLRRVVDGIWIEELEAEQKHLIQQAQSDPNALTRWREVDSHRRRRLNSSRQPTPTLT